MKYQDYMDAFPEINFAITNPLFYFWIILAFFFLIMEIGTPGLFFFISFFFGGLVAAVVSCVWESVIIQSVSFFAATSIALFVLRYVMMPLIAKGRPHVSTNVYALKGKQGFVTKQVSYESPGLVRVNGEIWAARVARGESAVVVGTLVEVVDMSGAHVVIKKV